MSAPIPIPIERSQAHPEDAAVVKAATGWVQHLSRTLKTCRLYDAANPAVLRFRGQLHESLRDLLAGHGALSFRFTSDDVQLDGASLYPARSRDDNLALAFFRDGVREITFKPGIERAELDTMIDGLLLVTGHAQGEDDLVTLLWQANLPHLQIEHITAEGDISDPTGAEAHQVPWPTGSSETPDDATTATADAETPAGAPRSDDWDIGDVTADLEASWEALLAIADTEVLRFRGEYTAEREARPVPMAIALSAAYMAASATSADLQELAHFLPRVLRMAMNHGDWRGASDAITLLERCENAEWSRVAFGQELNQPISVAGIVQWIDQQEHAGVDDFVALTGLLDAPGVDLLNLVLVELKNPVHRAKLTEAVVEACRDQPEHLAAWLADPRPWVVQQVVQMLSQIGGPTIVGMLRAVAKHADSKVRHEVVAALRRADPDQARPVLSSMLDDSDTRTFCTILQVLSDRRDPELSQRLIAYLAAPEFERRIEEEKRSIYLALAAAAGDEVVPEIEVELHRASWFIRGPDPHRQALGRCLARIGTPLAREVLERGARSKKAVVRKACADALEALNRNG